MTRAYQIYGEFMVNVRGGQHLPSSVGGFNNNKIAQLGLTSEAVTIVPRFRHKEIYTDDYGKEIPAELMCYMADAQVNITLVHYDEDVLQICMQETMGGGDGSFSVLGNDGIMPRGGRLLGNNISMYFSGNHYLSVSLFPAASVKGWRFTSCYLNSQPLVIPVGAERSLVQLSFRAIPYSTMTSGEVLASGVVLWDRIPDEYVP